MSKYDTAPIV